jgi:hypothetical protein
LDLLLLLHGGVFPSRPRLREGRGSVFVLVGQSLPDLGHLEQRVPMIAAREIIRDVQAFCR